MQRPCLRFVLMGTALLGAVPVAAATCATAPTRPAARRHVRPCLPARKPEPIRPYDPDDVEAGRRPGFIDLGNGTEIRIGGRARFDYDVRR